MYMWKKGSLPVCTDRYFSFFGFFPWTSVSRLNTLTQPPSGTKSKDFNLDYNLEHEKQVFAFIASLESAARYSQSSFSFRPPCEITQLFFVEGCGQTQRPPSTTCVFITELFRKWRYSALLFVVSVHKDDEKMAEMPLTDMWTEFQGVSQYVLKVFSELCHNKCWNCRSQNLHQF